MDSRPSLIRRGSQARSPSPTSCRPRPDGGERRHQRWFHFARSPVEIVVVCSLEPPSLGTFRRTCVFGFQQVEHQPIGQFVQQGGCAGSDQEERGFGDGGQVSGQVVGSRLQEWQFGWYLVWEVLATGAFILAVLANHISMLNLSFLVLCTTAGSSWISRRHFRVRSVFPARL